MQGRVEVCERRMDTGWRTKVERGLEGQAEVLAHHLQTGGSHRVGVVTGLKLAHLGSNPSSSACQLCSLGQVN